MQRLFKTDVRLLVVVALGLAFIISGLFASGFLDPRSADAAQTVKATPPTLTSPEGEYIIKPYLGAEGHAPGPIAYSHQPSTLEVQMLTGDTAQVTVYLNLVWPGIPAPGAASVFLSGMPPATSVGGAVGPSGWSGNFEGFHYPAGGNFSMDTNFTVGPAGNWYLVISVPDAPPYNLRWGRDMSTTTTSDGSIGPGRLRGTLIYVTSASALTDWLNAGIASSTITKVS